MSSKTAADLKNIISDFGKVGNPLVPKHRKRWLVFQKKLM